MESSAASASARCRARSADILGWTAATHIRLLWRLPDAEPRSTSPPSVGTCGLGVLTRRPVWPREQSWLGREKQVHKPSHTEHDATAVGPPRGSEDAQRPRSTKTRPPRRACAVCALRPPCPAAGPAPHSWRSLLGDWNPAPWMPLNKRFCSNGLDTPASARRVTALDSAPAPKGRPCVGRGAVATTGRERGRGARAPRPRKGGASRRPRGARVNASEAAAGAWTDLDPGEAAAWARRGPGLRPGHAPRSCYLRAVRSVFPLS